MSFTSSRDYYHPSGHVGTFPLCILIILAAAIVLAGVLATLFKFNFYFVLFMPAAAAMALGGLVWVLVGTSHCRAPMFAAVTSGILGAFTYLLFYHITFVNSFDPNIAHRIDLLPNYIWLRLQTDEVRKFSDDPNKQKNMNPNVRTGFNIMFFLMEFGVMVMAPATFALNRARKAYWEEGGEWMSDHIANLPFEAADDLRDALDSYDDLTTSLQQYSTAIPLGKFCRLTLNVISTPKAGHSSLRQVEAPVYLTVSIAQIIQGKAKEKPFIKRLQLKSSETAAIAHLFPDITISNPPTAIPEKVQAPDEVSMPLAVTSSSITELQVPGWSEWTEHAAQIRQSYPFLVCLLTIFVTLPFIKSQHPSIIFGVLLLPIFGSLFIYFFTASEGSRWLASRLRRNVQMRDDGDFILNDRSMPVLLLGDAKEIESFKALSQGSHTLPRQGGMLSVDHQNKVIEFVGRKCVIRIRAEDVKGMVPCSHTLSVYLIPIIHSVAVALLFRVEGKMYALPIQPLTETLSMNSRKKKEANLKRLMENLGEVLTPAGRPQR